tara:strand:+ start:1836 stop:2138 length:303 start_codon:yes stop_codon:yes gene_type:complete
MFSSGDLDKVAYFGHWADESGQRRLMRDAVGTLREAVLNCADKDVRTEELKQALLFLERHMTRPEHCARFRQNLEIRDPMLRVLAVRETFASIVKTLSPS